MFRFGNAQKVSGKLDEMLEKPQLTVQQLFEIKDIIGDIKQKVEPFVEYCQKHREFTLRIIELGLNTSLQELEEKNLKEVAFVATEFLSCDEDGLGQLFFESPEEGNDKKSNAEEEGVKNESQISERIEGEGESNDMTETEGETDKVKQTQEKVIEAQPQEKKQGQKPVFEEYELVKQSLKILENPTLNETCLGYISKLYSFLIRKDSDQPLKFFSIHDHYTALLIKNIKYDSISNLLAQIVASEDKNREYKYEEYKRTVFDRILQSMIENIQDESVFDGTIVFIEEVLNNTKQSYYEYFEDFKRCANVLVSEKTLRRLFELIFDAEKRKQTNVFKNCVTYLHMIAKRINADNDDMDYYDSCEKKDPTMNFETDFLYKEMDSLVDLIPKIIDQGSISINLYLSFLNELMKNQKFNIFSYDFVKNFQKLIKCLYEWKSSGIIKNSLFQIIELSIFRAEAQQIHDLLENHENFIRQNFALNDQSEPTKTPEEQQTSAENKSLARQKHIRKYNKKEEICYSYKILFLLKEKDQTAFSQKFQELNSKMQPTQTKYQTKLAAPSTLKESSDFGIFANRYVEQEKKGPQFINNEQEEVIEEPPVVSIADLSCKDNNEQSFGSFAARNNIFIPQLNLPPNNSGSGNVTKIDRSITPSDPTEGQQKKDSDVIVDLDSERVVIEEEEVQRVQINSPKRGMVSIGFMATSSPRNIDLSGSARSDRSSQGSNSARDKIEEPKEVKKDNFFKSSPEKKTEEEKKVPKKFTPEEVTFFVRHAILI